MNQAMTPDELHRTFSRLRAMHHVIKGPRLIIPEGAVFRLDLTEQRLLAALQRDQGPGPERDGYPTGNLGSGGQDAPQSSAEAAVMAGYQTERNIPVEHAQGWWKPPAPDPHHANTQAAIEALQTLDQAWRTLLRRLDAIDNDRATTKHSNPGGECIICGRWVEGTADDRLRRGMCDKDRKAWERAGQPDLEWYRPDPNDLTIERARWTNAA